MYLTIGFTAGFGASAGVGYYTTNRGFRNSDIEGSAANLCLQIYPSPISIEGAGDWRYGGEFPGSKTRLVGGNIGVGVGYFVSLR
jgi:hypothetical protein